MSAACIVRLFERNDLLLDAEEIDCLVAYAAADSETVYTTVRGRL